MGPKEHKNLPGFYLSLHNSLADLTLFFCCFCVERLEPIRSAFLEFWICIADA